MRMIGIGVCIITNHTDTNPYTNHEQGFVFITLLIEIIDLIHKIYGIKET